MTSDIAIRLMHENDLEEVDRIIRLAFGTFIGLPDPMSFMGDADYAHTRYHTDPPAALVAQVDGRIVGSNFALHWGSVGVFGPLTVHPEFWDKGVARRLVEDTMDIFEKWQVKHAGLFTFAQSGKHVHLYQKFGFWPRFLTAVMSKPVQRTVQDLKGSQWVRYSELASAEKEKTIEACKRLTGDIYDGLDLRKEIYSVEKQGLGDTILLLDHDALGGFAICHCGPGTEAGSGTCYVKFGAARPGHDSEQFDLLLDACESFAGSQDLSRIVAGVNMGRHNAYARMIARKFRTDLQGVAMHRPNEPGYNREDVYLIDDWR
jgi:predicted N-acetyltransferase YhbS